MKRILLFGLLIGCAIGLFSNPLARIYQVDDPLLLRIEELSWESGINPFVPSGPVSGYELDLHLQKIDAGKLTSRSREILAETHGYLHDPYRGKAFDYSIRAAFEGYVNTNDTFMFYDWVEGYVDRTPPLSFQIESIFGDHAHGVFSYTIPKRFYEDSFQGFSTNLPEFLGIGTGLTQNSPPYTAFLGFSDEWFTMVAGRDALRLGRGNTGNLMLNDNGPYNDFISVSVANGFIKYTLLAVPMNELMVADGAMGEGAAGEAWYPHMNPPGSWHTLFHGTMRRIYVAHRIDLDFFPWWRVTVAEGVLFYADHLDVRMFSPVYYLHNLQNFGEVNNSVGMESEVTLSRNWSLVAQILADQIQTKGEQGTDPDNRIAPNAYGFLLGARYLYPLAEWKIKGFFEGAYSSPFLYLRTGDQTANYGGDPNLQYNLDLVNAVSMADGKSGVSWLGYPDGPDSIVFATRLDLVYQDRFSVFAGLRFKVEGERGLKIWGKKQKLEQQLIADINLPSPSGPNPISTLVIGLGGTVRLFDSQVEVGIRNHLVNKWSSGNHRFDNQLGFGISWTF